MKVYVNFNGPKATFQGLNTGRISLGRAQPCQLTLGRYVRFIS